MSEPEIVNGPEKAPKPWPLHAGVTRTLKGLSPFGMILAWALAAMLALVFMAGSVSSGVCSGFSCSPVLAVVFAATLVVLPVTAVAIGLLGLMTLLRLSMATRLWTAAVAPPIGFVVMVLVLG